MLTPTLAFGELTGMVRVLVLTASWRLGLWVADRVLAHPEQAPAPRLVVGPPGPA